MGYRFLVGLHYLTAIHEKKSFTRREIEEQILALGCKKQDFSSVISILKNKNLIQIAEDDQFINGTPVYKITETGRLEVGKLIKLYKSY